MLFAGLYTFLYIQGSMDNVFDYLLWNLLYLFHPDGTSLLAVNNLLMWDNFVWQYTEIMTISIKSCDTVLSANIMFSCKVFSVGGRNLCRLWKGDTSWNPLPKERQHNFSASINNAFSSYKLGCGHSVSIIHLRTKAMEFASYKLMEIIAAHS
jgi:hypothetical protein